jgi:hypothetical protein
MFEPFEVGATDGERENELVDTVKRIQGAGEDDWVVLEESAAVGDTRLLTQEGARAWRPILPSEDDLLACLEQFPFDRFFAYLKQTHDAATLKAYPQLRVNQSRRDFEMDLDVVPLTALEDIAGAKSINALRAVAAGARCAEMISEALVSPHFVRHRAFQQRLCALLARICTSLPDPAKFVDPWPLPSRSLVASSKHSPLKSIASVRASALSYHWGAPQPQIATTARDERDAFIRRVCKRLLDADHGTGWRFLPALPFTSLTPTALFFLVKDLTNELDRAVRDSKPAASADEEHHKVESFLVTAIASAAGAARSGMKKRDVPSLNRKLLSFPAAAGSDVRIIQIESGDESTEEDPDHDADEDADVDAARITYRAHQTVKLAAECLVRAGAALGGAFWRTCREELSNLCSRHCDVAVGAILSALDPTSMGRPAELVLNSIPLRSWRGEGDGTQVMLGWIREGSSQSLACARALLQRMDFGDDLVVVETVSSSGESSPLTSRRADGSSRPRRLRRLWTRRIHCDEHAQLLLALAKLPPLTQQSTLWPWHVASRLRPFAFRSPSAPSFLYERYQPPVPVLAGDRLFRGIAGHAKGATVLELWTDMSLEEIRTRISPALAGAAPYDPDSALTGTIAVAPSSPVPSSASFVSVATSAASSLLFSSQLTSHGLGESHRSNTSVDPLAAFAALQLSSLRDSLETFDPHGWQLLHAMLNHPAGAESAKLAIRVLQELLPAFARTSSASPSSSYPRYGPDDSYASSSNNLFVTRGFKTTISLLLSKHAGTLAVELEEYLIRGMLLAEHEVRASAWAFSVANSTHGEPTDPVDNDRDQMKLNHFVDEYTSTWSRAVFSTFPIDASSSGFGPHGPRISSASLGGSDSSQPSAQGHGTFASHVPWIRHPGCVTVIDSLVRAAHACGRPGVIRILLSEEREKLKAHIRSSSGNSSAALLNQESADETPPPLGHPASALTAASSSLSFMASAIWQRFGTSAQQSTPVHGNFVDFEAAYGTPTSLITPAAGVRSMRAALSSGTSTAAPWASSFSINTLISSRLDAASGAFSSSGLDTKNLWFALEALALETAEESLKRSRMGVYLASRTPDAGESDQATLAAGANGSRGASSIAESLFESMTIYRWALYSCVVPDNHPLLPLFLQGFFALYFELSSPHSSPPQSPTGTISADLFIGARYFDAGRGLEIMSKLKARLSHLASISVDNDSAPGPAAPQSDTDASDGVDILRRRVFAAMHRWLSNSPRGNMRHRHPGGGPHSMTAAAALLITQNSPENLPDRLGHVLNDPIFSYPELFWWELANVGVIRDDIVTSVRNRWFTPDFNSVEELRKRTGGKAEMAASAKSKHGKLSKHRAASPLSSMPLPAPSPAFRRPMIRAREISDAVLKDATSGNAFDPRLEVVAWHLVREEFDALRAEAKSFVDFQSAHAALDRDYLLGLAQLYRTSTKGRKRVAARCSDGCKGPAFLDISYQESILNTNLADALEENRLQAQDAAARSLRVSTEACCAAMRVVRTIEKLHSRSSSFARAHSAAPVYNPYHRAGVLLFFSVLRNVDPSLRAFPPLYLLIKTVVDQLGSKFVSLDPSESTRVLQHMLHDAREIDLLADSFAPWNATLEFPQLFKSVGDSVETLDPAKTVSLLCRFKVEQWLETGPPVDRRRMVVSYAFLALGRLGSPPPPAMIPVREVYRGIVNDLLRLRFDQHYPDALVAILEGVKTKTLDLVLLTDFIVAVSQQRHERDSVRANFATSTLHRCTLMADFISRILMDVRRSAGALSTGLGNYSGAILELSAVIVQVAAKAFDVVSPAACPQVASDCCRIMESLFRPWFFSLRLESVARPTTLAGATDDLPALAMSTFVEMVSLVTRNGCRITTLGWAWRFVLSLTEAAEDHVVAWLCLETARSIPWAGFPISDQTLRSFHEWAQSWQAAEKFNELRVFSEKDTMRPGSSFISLASMGYVVQWMLALVQVGDPAPLLLERVNANVVFEQDFNDDSSDFGLGSAESPSTDLAQAAEHFFEFYAFLSSVLDQFDVGHATLVQGALAIDSSGPVMDPLVVATDSMKRLQRIAQDFPWSKLSHNGFLQVLRNAQPRWTRLGNEPSTWMTMWLDFARTAGEFSSGAGGEEATDRIWLKTEAYVDHALGLLHEAITSNSIRAEAIQQGGGALSSTAAPGNAPSTGTRLASFLPQFVSSRLAEITGTKKTERWVNYSPPDVEAAVKSVLLVIQQVAFREDPPSMPISLPSLTRASRLVSRVFKVLNSIPKTAGAAADAMSTADGAWYTHAWEGVSSFCKEASLLGSAAVIDAAGRTIASPAQMSRMVEICIERHIREARANFAADPWPAMVSLVPLPELFADEFTKECAEGASGLTISALLMKEMSSPGADLSRAVQWIQNFKFGAGSAPKLAALLCMYFDFAQRADAETTETTGLHLVDLASFLFRAAEDSPAGIMGVFTWDDRPRMDPFGQILARFAAFYCLALDWFRTARHDQAARAELSNVDEMPLVLVTTFNAVLAQCKGIKAADKRLSSIIDTFYSQITLSLRTKRLSFEGARELVLSLLTELDPNSVVIIPPRVL